MTRDGRIAMGRIGDADHRDRDRAGGPEQLAPACASRLDRQRAERVEGLDGDAGIRVADDRAKRRQQLGRHRARTNRQRPLRKRGFGGHLVSHLDHQSDALARDDLLGEEDIQRRRDRLDLHIVVDIGDELTPAEGPPPGRPHP